VPSVYEHGAALIGRSPGEVSRDPALMAAAALEAYRLYAHDILTVGIDIYNVEAGTSLIVADFNTDFDFIRSRTEGRNALVRGCVDPKAIERGDWRHVRRSVEALARKAAGMRGFVWGCGCVSYNTPKEHVLRFKDMCLRPGRPRRER